MRKQRLLPARCSAFAGGRFHLRVRSARQALFCRTSGSVSIWIAQAGRCANQPHRIDRPCGGTNSGCPPRWRGGMLTLGRGTAPDRRARRSLAIRTKKNSMRTILVSTDDEDTLGLVMRRLWRAPEPDQNESSGETNRNDRAWFCPKRAIVPENITGFPTECLRRAGSSDPAYTQTSMVRAALMMVGSSGSGRQPRSVESRA